MKLKDALFRLSLKARLAIMFCTMMVLVTGFSGFMLVEYHQIALGGAEIARRSHDEMSRAMEMQDCLTQIGRLASMGEVNEAEITHFRRLISQVKSLSDNPEVIDEVDRIGEKFDQFVDSIETYKYAPGWTSVKRAYYDDVAVSVGALTERNQSAIYSLADSIRQKQVRALQISVLSILAFMLIFGLTFYRLISYLVTPLMTMARFIDGIDVESNTPLTIPVPHLGSTPEVLMVSRSFDRLLDRLRVYRALNLRRLLSEKRRADIIAASISDGIILLKGQEVLYSNPVADQILKVEPERTAEGNSSRGLKAVLSTVEQTMPVEFSMESEDGRRYFLIQAFPISHALVDQVVDQQTLDVAGEFQATTLVVAQDVTIVRESQEAKGHFLATLSHEVKTPVTSLTLATRMLLRMVDQFDSPTQQSLVRTCTEDVDRLRVLLDELLTVSRFDSLTQRIQFQYTDIAKLLKHSVQSFQKEAKEKGIALQVDVFNEGRASLVMAMDPTKIAWALSNLLTNALRHSPRGSKVQVALEARSEWIEVRLRDSGPGIDKRRLERIFDKFTSFYDIRVARSGSAGLGLSIAREIIQAHGGRIWATSEIGEGTEFGFMLPFKKKYPDLKGENVNVLSKGDEGGASARSG